MSGEGRSSADPGEYRGEDRRHRRSSSPSSADVLREIPALVVLDRLPNPTLAIGADGAIVFANSAFVDLLGYPREQIRGLPFEKIFQSLPTDNPPIDALRAYAGEVVELAHRDGYVVRARMSKSALMRRDDDVMLATFDDISEQLWRDGP